MIASDTEYTTIKVPKSYVVAARRLQSELVRRGVDHLPIAFEEAAKSDVCPLCGGRMMPVAAQQHLRCECGMAKHRVDLADAAGDVLRGIGVGALVGLGLYLLGKAMAGEGAPEKAEQAAGKLDAIRHRSKPGPHSTRKLAQAGRR